MLWLYSEVFITRGPDWPWGGPQPTWGHCWPPSAPPSCEASAPSEGTGWSALWSVQKGYGTSCWSWGQGSWTSSGTPPVPCTKPAAPSYTGSPGKCLCPSGAINRPR